MEIVRIRLGLMVLLLLVVLRLMVLRLMMLGLVVVMMPVMGILCLGSKWGCWGSWVGC